METILDRAEVAAEQVTEAVRSGDPIRLRSVLVYWFGVLYDEGRVAAAQTVGAPLKDTVERLKEMNRRLSDRQLPAAREDPEGSGGLPED
jgi:hypothetical protein